MASFIDNLKTVMAPYRVGAMPKFLKTTGEVKNLKNDWGENEVKASALRDVIKKKTDNKVEVTDSINDENSLLTILRSYLQMKNYGNGNLVPDNVVVFNPNPNALDLGMGISGQYWPKGGTEQSRDPIAVLYTSWNSGEKPKLDTSEGRIHPVTGEKAQITIPHELAHAAGIAYDKIASRYAKRFEENINKYKNRYSSDDISAKIADATRKAYEVRKEIREAHDYPSDLFERAAKNTGFSSVDEANKSISAYAATDWAEAFAEAYSDVLLNGDNAVPYSKELIRLYSEAADKWSKRVGKDNTPMQIGRLKELMDVSPTKDALSIKKKGAK